jgi:hypothetical protein
MCEVKYSTPTVKRCAGNLCAVIVGRWTLERRWMEAPKSPCNPEDARADPSLCRRLPTSSLLQRTPLLGTCCETMSNIGIKSNVLCESNSDYNNPDSSFYRKPELVASLRRNYAARQQISRLLSSEPNILLFDRRYSQLWSFGKSPIGNPATRKYSGWTDSSNQNNYAKWGKAEYYCSGLWSGNNRGRVLGMDCCRGQWGS